MHTSMLCTWTDKWNVNSGFRSLTKCNAARLSMCFCLFHSSSPTMFPENVWQCHPFTAGNHTPDSSFVVPQWWNELPNRAHRTHDLISFTSFPSTPSQPWRHYIAFRKFSDPFIFPTFWDLPKMKVQPLFLDIKIRLNIDITCWMTR